ncbi:sodium channel modifier 1-like isoform X1 [Rhodnius prolixus]|uniref:sodium channel modifier 1-like isoform X1 n=2 Tax=Rhodnius prolixus TaxID=13249 RepID=UPI003D18EB19
MSFKRDGDDISLLNRLKKQRVSEILGDHIPEDEAKLLSNGRLTCLVCTHRPIFDTTTMLAKHRQGKKHLFELNKYIKRNEQLELLKIKKEQHLLMENQKRLELVNSVNIAQLLGQKSNESSELKAGNRRKVIELPIVVNKLPISCEPKKPSSSASQLRKYLKGIKKKQSLESVLDRKKSTYSSRSSESMDAIHSYDSGRDAIQITSNKPRSLQAENDFSRHLSGWIKDKSGNWKKDPEAEFDTDDEDNEISIQKK